MRASCVSCAKPQPVDWKPGERCVHCGEAVRRELRCFWCAKASPEGRFCRACGADLVDDPLYGAARMLKDAGTDRFSIPKLLKEFDAERIDHFTRLYQRHAAVVARHADDLRFLERFLFHQTWSAALEDELVPRLPFPEAELKALTLDPRPVGANLDVAKHIQETSPFPRTRLLAALARVRLDDASAVRDAAPALRDPALAPEAALVLTGWRVLLADVSPAVRDREVLDLLRASPFREAAAVRLGLLGQGDPDRLRAALDSKDPETAFAAALALGDVDRLSAALPRGEELLTVAAGRALARQGVFLPLAPVLRTASLDVQADLVHELSRQKRPAPELKGVLLDLVEQVRWDSPESVRQGIFVPADRVRRDLRQRATIVLARSCDAETALRLARASGGDSLFVQPLLADWSGAPPDAVEAVLDHLVSIGKFRDSQWNLDDAVGRGAVSPGFVPSRWAGASPEMRVELVGLAEKQLRLGADEGLHRFLVNVVFGPADGKLRAEAWWALHRTYRKDDVRGEGPLRLEEAPIARFFGSPEAFVPKLVAVLRDDEALREVGLYDFLAHFLKPVDPAFAARIAGADLARALLRVAGGDYYAFLVDAAIDLIGHVGADPRWRDEVVAGLEALGKKGNYPYDRALRRLRLGVHGMPDESEWTGLGWAFAPERFANVSREGRLELLRLVEHQRIHEEEETAPLGDWLLEVAFGGFEPDVRFRALEIHAERSPHGHGLDLLARPDLLPGVAAAFQDDALLADRRFQDFLEEILGQPAPTGDALVAPLLGVVGRAGSAPDRLRLRALAFLGRLGDDPARRGAVADGFLALAGRPGFDLADACRREADRLEPPRPEKEPDPEPEPADRPRGGCGMDRFPHPAADPPAPPPRSPDDAVPQSYEEKAKLAERLGRELQEACLRISFGDGSPEEKTRAILKLQDEFQLRLKRLYGA